MTETPEGPERIWMPDPDEQGWAPAVWDRAKAGDAYRHEYVRADLARSVPESGTIACGGCGETDPAKRCIGCLHDFGRHVPRPGAEQTADCLIDWLMDQGGAVLQNGRLELEVAFDRAAFIEAVRACSMLDAGTTGGRP